MALCLMPACLILACLAASAPVRAQNQAVDDLKGKIFDARMAKQTFAAGLKFCNELDGKHFYFQARDRVLDLEEYHRSDRTSRARSSMPAWRSRPSPPD